ncbi:non-ribosomal peptide synthetase [Rhodococcus tibetensis]|uniref:Amino acid adenylation domain-containing protein n=1 Tax=Rhodococcus tibetensis TaxID=2965064 RepID=A0ABT1QFX2_9NOCA|nr:non-ribosomal peptide synthetase [Rhodococcus sp. FXJ9.536]MCQ4121178.1 amino acid adenylation domain-containing protein [Rhodococcus sp. FXJ9.536]
MNTDFDSPQSGGAACVCLERPTCARHHVARPERPLAHPTRSIDGALPLTAAQRSIWFAQQLAPEIPYVIAHYAELHGPVELAVLDDATRRAHLEFGWGSIRLVDIDGQPHQVVDTTMSNSVPTTDFRGEDDPVEAAHRWMRHDRSARTDMYGGPLLVSHILQLGDEHYYWYSRAHHIASDGYAAMMLMSRTADLYVAAVEGRDPPDCRIVGPERLVQEDAAYRASTRFVRDRDYWREQGSDLPPVVGLSRRAARPDTTARTVTGHAARSSSSRNQAAVAVAAFASYLATMCGVEDVVLSLPVSARTTARLRASGGCVSNVIPLRLGGIGSGTVRSAVATAEAALTAALRHQRYRREDIGRDLASGGVELLHFGPVINLMMFKEITLGAVQATVRVLTTGPVADLAVNIYPGSSERAARVDFEGNSSLYGHDELTGHYDRFLAFLDRFTASIESECLVSDLDVFLAGERGIFAPAQGFPNADPITLDRLLAGSVASDPGAVAIRDRGRELSYGDLDRLANRLARILIGRGIGPENFVAVSVPRSIESVLALWAVAKTGAAYVPIDPTHPSARVAYSLADCGAAVGLTVRAEQDRLPDTVEWLAIDIDEPESFCDEASSGAPDDAERVSPLLLDHPAYLIYTSGSTGVPKGVVVTHRGLANLAQEIRDKYAVSARSRVLHFASPSFDTALVEVLAACVGGATLVVTPPGHFGGDELSRLLREEHVTHLLTTPSALAAIDPAAVDELELVLVGGEVCPPELARRWAGGRTLRNAYGPTETTCSVTLTEPMSPDGTVTIGALMRGVDAVVLDRRLRPLPPGAAGELYLATPAIARGYHRRHDLTAARFVANPFGHSGSRMFRTGDVVRWTVSGTLEFLDRADDQVKIRGFRVELGEINATLSAYPGVAFAATMVHENSVGDPNLVSYIMTEKDAPIDRGALKAHVARFLPDYMIPKSFMLVNSIPLTPTGKLDRSVLPLPEFGSDSVPHRDPETLAERRVARVFAQVLGVDSVGADDSFFDLSGDSLSAIRVVATINAELGTTLGVRELFDAPTVAALAQSITEACEHPSSAELARRPKLGATPLPECVPLSPSQQFIDRALVEPALYNIPFTVRVRGPFDIEALRSAMADVLDRHRSLRTVYPDSPWGPYQRVLDVADALPDLVPVPAGESAAQAQTSTLLTAGFDVRRDPPLRARLFRLADGDHLLSCVLHHIAADGWSLAPLARDLADSYRARSTGGEPEWEPPVVQYADYTVWRRMLLGAEDDPDSVASRQIAHWTQELSGLRGELSLPTDRPRPRRWTYRARRLQFSLDEHAHRGLLATAHEHHASLFTALRSAVAVLLARLSGDPDIAIGTPIAGRGDPVLDDVVGMFVNTLVLRTRVDPSMSLSDIVDRSRDVELRALANADVQFERLVEVLDPPRSQSLHPLFQVALSLNNFAPAAFDVSGLDFEVTPRPLDIAKCDLHFHFTECHDVDGKPTGIEAELVYSADLFDVSTAQSFVDTLHTIVEPIGR